jgi:hypothetical protein
MRYYTYSILVLIRFFVAGMLTHSSLGKMFLILVTGSISNWTPKLLRFLRKLSQLKITFKSVFLKKFKIFAYLTKNLYTAAHNITDETPRKKFDPSRVLNAESSGISFYLSFKTRRLNIKNKSLVIKILISLSVKNLNIFFH